MQYDYAFKRRSLLLPWRWFQKWLKDTLELYTIKTKPIASHRVNTHTKKDLCNWFEKEYRPALEFTGIRSGQYIHNIDEKGCRIACPSGEEVVVLIRIKEIYVRVPENQLSVKVIKGISADGTAIPPLVTVPERNIMVSWFSEKMTGAEIVSVSLSGYTNKEIYLQ